MVSDRLVMPLLPIFVLAALLVQAQPCKAQGTDTVRAPSSPPQNSQGQNSQTTVRPTSPSNATISQPSQGSCNGGTITGAVTRTYQVGSQPPAGMIIGPAPGVSISPGISVNFTRPVQLNAPGSATPSTQPAVATPQEIVACQTKIAEAEKTVSQGNWPKGIQEILVARQMNSNASQKDRLKSLLEQIDAEAQRRLSAAQSLADQGKYAESLKAYQEIIVVFPGRPAATAAVAAAGKVRADQKYSLIGADRNAKDIEAQLEKLLAVRQPTTQPADQLTVPPAVRPAGKETGKDEGNGGNTRVLQLRSVPPDTQVKALYLIETQGGKFALTEPGTRAAAHLVEIKKHNRL
ncbi:MAG: hypothetical protein HZA50_03345 [Planctomycetes bacterium]|nr:hypothetical protein [Planctomycetota bacterium]